MWASSWQIPTLCLRSGIVSPLWLRWIEGVCVFRCKLPPALLAEWLGSFTCHCGNTRVEQTPTKSPHTKLTLDKNILPPLLPEFELATMRSQVQCSTYKLSHLSVHFNKTINMYISTNPLISLFVHLKPSQTNKSVHLNQSTNQSICTSQTINLYISTNPPVFTSEQNHKSVHLHQSTILKNPPISLSVHLHQSTNLCNSTSPSINQSVNLNQSTNLCISTSPSVIRSVCKTRSVNHLSLSPPLHQSSDQLPSTSNKANQSISYVYQSINPIKQLCTSKSINHLPTSNKVDQSIMLTN